jgi:uncharacterized membrane protein YebE (DUF533 family)
MDSPSAKGAMGGAASGALVTLLMHPKSRKKLGKTAVKVGGMAALAGVGYYGYKQWQKSKEGPVASPPSPSVAASAAVLEVPESEVEVSDSLGEKMLLAMISAAASDGKIDGCEMDILLDSMEMAELTPEENRRLTAALNHPPTLEAVAGLAANPEEASELYAASITAIDPDTPAENMYLRRLARALQLEASLVRQIHAAAGMTA